MQINFTGIKNASMLHARVPLGGVSLKVVAAELTDDYSGHDLSSFQDAVKKSNNGKFKNDVNRNFVNFSILSADSDNINIENSRMLLNGELLVPKDENLKILTFLANMTKKIAEKPPKDFVLNRDYFQGDDFNKIALTGVFLPDLLKDKYDMATPLMVDPFEVKRISSAINEDLKAIMLDYFA